MTRTMTDRRVVIPQLGEVFRELGFAGASLSEITGRTGLGKGSLYHFFPGGKDEMAQAVLEDVAGWFEANVFAPLRAPNAPLDGIRRMFAEVDRFFRSGRRVCLVGAFALDGTRDRFAATVQAYFADWTAAIADALRRGGANGRGARETAEDIIAGIQGALVLARSLNDPTVFSRALRRRRRQAEEALGG
jgi:TetR/AcrR family transcriptional repressor of lmrAB and yxaGH operons